MPKLSPKVQADRISRILDAAEVCFARSGFHGTTIQDICAEAKISAGALYVYFDSKEALITGIVERERAEFARSFELLGAAPDFMSALEQMVLHYFRDDPVWKRRVGVEIGVEATRNPRVAAIYEACDRDIRAHFVALFERLIAEGRIAPAATTHDIVDALMVIGDGLFWRRAVQSDFDAEAVLPLTLKMIEALLSPARAAPAEAIPNRQAAE